MTSAARRCTATGMGLLGWLFPASLGLHAALLVGMPAAHRGKTSPPLPAVTMIDAPEPPKPPEPEPEPAAKAEPERVLSARVTPAARPPTTPVAVAPLESQNVASTSNPADDVPVDFTATPGTSVTTATRAAPGPAGAPTGARATLTAAPFVAAGSLARSPRSPAGLDAELERNYPLAARRAGVSGRAVLRVRIAPDGRVAATTTVSESFEGFAAACDRTVRAGRWEPPVDREGRAVSTEITYTCRFEVRS